jgi:hypothetical protein
MIYGSKERKKGELPPFKIRVPLNSVDAFVSACVRDARAHGYTHSKRTFESPYEGVPIFRVNSVVEKSAETPIRMAPKREISDVIAHEHIVELDSSLLEEIAEDVAPKVEAKPEKIEFLDLSSIKSISLDDEFTRETLMTELYDMKKVSYSKRKRFDEAIEFDRYFNSREELGLSVDYFKDRHGNDQFRYRSRKDSGKGRWISAKYVHEAVGALKQYDALVKEGTWDGLKKARGIAKKYFTGKEAGMAYAVIDSKLEKAAMRLVDLGRMKYLTKDVALEVYHRLINCDHAHYIGKMVDFARRNISADAAQDAQRWYSIALHRNGPKLSVISNDSVQARQQYIPQQRARAAQVAAA